MRSFRSALTVFLTLLLLVLVLLLMPLGGLPGVDSGYLDKLVHALLFLALTAAALRVWPQAGWWLLPALCFLGVVTELLQGLTGWRTASAADALADMVGVLLALIWHCMRIKVATHRS